VIESASLPDANVSTSDAVDFWTQNRGSQMTVAILASLSGLALLWFAGTLRSVLRRAEGGDTLATISLAGAVVAVSGFFLDTSIEYTAAHSAGDVPAQVTQTLSVLQADTWLPIAGGFAVFGLATGLALLYGAVMPKWLAWVSLVAGALWLTPAQILGMLLSVIFVVATSIQLLRGRVDRRVAEPGATGVALGAWPKGTSACSSTLRIRAVSWASARAYSSR
jgi:hypothetical protein